VADVAGGATPFQGVTANSLYVTLALFLMTAPGGAQMRGGRLVWSCARAPRTQPAAWRWLASSAAPHAARALRTRDASSPHARQQQRRCRTHNPHKPHNRACACRHLVAGQARAHGRAQAPDVRGARPRGGGVHAARRARAPDLQV
jgi:hypothetical protein